MVKTLFQIKIFFQIKLNESRYNALYVISRSMKELFLIDYVKISLFSIFFSIAFVSIFLSSFFFNRFSSVEKCRVYPTVLISWFIKVNWFKAYCYAAAQNFKTSWFHSAMRRMVIYMIKSQNFEAKFIFITSISFSLMKYVLIKLDWVLIS